MRFFSLGLLISLLMLPLGQVAGESPHALTVGDTIDNRTYITDLNGDPHSLNSLLGKDHAKINLIYFVGGGDMGSEKLGRLWCPDSAQDSYIIRSLYRKYAGNGLSFIIIAVTPGYHPQGTFKVSARALMNESRDSVAYKSAEQAFVASTRAAYEAGTFPVEPYLDINNRFMLNPDPSLAPGENYGPGYSWQGAFRDPAETQRYGVPSLWLLNNQGQVIAPPLSGNRYFHDGDFSINYTLTDVGALIDAKLSQQ